MSLSNEIQISLRAADDRLKLTAERINQFISEHERDMPSYAVVSMRSHLDALVDMRRKILSYRSGLERYLPEEEPRFLNNTRKLINRLDEIDLILNGITNLTSKLQALDSICPLWPFC